jgi:salicylate hydroxylase
VECPDLQVAVVGAGIGGLTAAIALARKGVCVSVYEQAPELAPVGASLALGPNATRLLDALGLGGGIRRVGVRAEAVELVRWDDGKVLLRTELGAPAEEYFGAPPLDFLRADLQAALLQALPDGVVELASQVTAVEQAENAATLLFADGRRVTAGAVVAADGIKSRIRQMFVGTDEPVFSGTVVYRGLVPRAVAPDLHPEHVNRYWLGPYRHGVVYWLSRGDVLAVNTAVQYAEWAEESWTAEAPTEELLGYLEGWDPALLDRVARCTTLLRGAVFVRRPLEQWTFDRVTLLGDAAHAMEPWQAQGAAQAIEDAFVLAECVEREDDVVDALVQYESLRMARATELQQSSASAGNVFYLPDGPEQQRRDAEYATLRERQPWGHRQKLWEYDVRDAFART